MNSPIQCNAEKRQFLLSTKAFSYAFAVNESGYLSYLHWGERIDSLDDLPKPEETVAFRHRQHGRQQVANQEYPGWGGEFYEEPALRVDFPEGVRGCLLKYHCYEIISDSDAPELIVTLEDSGYPLRVKLHYRVLADLDILERWSEVCNLGPGTATLKSVMSACLHLPLREGGYRLSHLSGRWGKECMIEKLPVPLQSPIVLESRTGLSGSFATPFFALDEGHATEHSGRVWFGALHWSGNWKVTVARDPYEQVHLCGGIHDLDFAWPLAPEETFTTPCLSIGISHDGFNAMSQVMHRYQRQQILPRAILKKPMPVIFNSWASMGIDVDEDRILKVAEKAAGIGAELFVIDDGWQSALGDWTPDLKKFPEGLKPVVEKVRALGMDFGLWVEIESVETKSRLFQEHPDWAMSYPNRPQDCHYRGDVDRTSMLLNFARGDVAEYMYEALRTLLLETGIRYLKLDMNYFFSTPGWADASPGTEQTIWVKYVRNVYDVFARLHAEFPDVIFENCAAGGGRADLGMSRYFSRINRSDNQDTLDVLRLHEGFTWMHPTRLAGGACHISDSIYGINFRRTPLRFQAYAGMMGSLAIGKNLLTSRAGELAEISTYVDLHKRIRHIAHEGDMYRLASHRESPYAAFQYVSSDKSEALLFVFGHAIQFGDRIPPIKLQGLDPDARYSVEMHCDENYSKEAPPGALDFRVLTGRGLMALGVQVHLLGDYDARILHFKCTSK